MALFVRLFHCVNPVGFKGRSVVDHPPLHKQGFIRAVSRPTLALVAVSGADLDVLALGDVSG